MPESGACAYRNADGQPCAWLEPHSHCPVCATVLSGGALEMCLGHLTAPREGEGEIYPDANGT